MFIQPSPIRDTYSLAIVRPVDDWTPGTPVPERAWVTGVDIFPERIVPAPGRSWQDVALYLVWRNIHDIARAGHLAIPSRIGTLQPGAIHAWSGDRHTDLPGTVIILRDTIIDVHGSHSFDIKALRHFPDRGPRWQDPAEGSWPTIERLAGDPVGRLLLALLVEILSRPGRHLLVGDVKAALRVPIFVAARSLVGNHSGQEAENRAMDAVNSALRDLVLEDIVQPRDLACPDSLFIPEAALAEIAPVIAPYASLAQACLSQIRPNEIDFLERAHVSGNPDTAHDRIAARHLVTRLRRLIETMIPETDLKPVALRRRRKAEVS